MTYNFHYLHYITSFDIPQITQVNHICRLCLNNIGPSFCNLVLWKFINNKVIYVQE